MGLEVDEISGRTCGYRVAILPLAEMGLEEVEKCEEVLIEKSQSFLEQMWV